MYDGLTPLFDQVTAPDLTKYFKSEALGAAGSPARPDRVRPTQGREDRPRLVQRPAHHRQDPRRRDVGGRLVDGLLLALPVLAAAQETVQREVKGKPDTDINAGILPPSAKTAPPGPSPRCGS